MSPALPLLYMALASVEMVEAIALTRDLKETLKSTGTLQVTMGTLQVTMVLLITYKAITW